MKNSNTFTISILLLCSMLLACNFKFGETTSDNINKESKQSNNSGEKTQLKKVKKTDDASTESDLTLPRRIGSFRFNRLEFLIYQIPKNSSKNELLKIAQNLHDKEPKSIINLADTDGTDEYIDFYERLEKKETGMEYPFDWEKKHIIGCVTAFGKGGEFVWYLIEGSCLNSTEKIAKLK